MIPSILSFALFVNHVWITQRKYRPVHLALAHAITSDRQKKWAIISNEPVDRPVFDEYGLRFCTEENPLDDKLGGFNLQDSNLEDADSLSRLCLILATATVYLVSTGKVVESLDQQDTTDPHLFRGLSYLQIG
ncbi:MAG: hypothetical protein AAF902_01435 [Chloroflexota bacterium]